MTGFNLFVLVIKVSGIRLLSTGDGLNATSVFSLWERREVRQGEDRGRVVSYHGVGSLNVGVKETGPMIRLEI